MKKSYIALKDLEVNKLAAELSGLAWQAYEILDWQDKKTMGDQFLQAIDSVGANIAEGYSRFHYLDRIKFYYNSRASMAEACDHWLELLHNRKKISKDLYENMKKVAGALAVKLNNFIELNYRLKEEQ